MKTLHEKIVVITGAASGIGRSLAVEAAKSGARLALGDWDEEGLVETVRLVRSESCPDRTTCDVLAGRVDVRSDGDVLSFAADVERALGGAHVLVNNAGVSLSDTIGSMKRGEFEWLFDINFWGTVRGTEAFLPQLTRRDDAHIVNLSSVYGLVGMPSQSAYNASKFAVRGYTEALAQELEGSTVHVTCIYPGGVRTNIVRNGRHHRNWRNEPTTNDSTELDFAKLARTTASEAARAIWSGVLGNRSRVLVGVDARLLDLLQRAFPSAYPVLLSKVRRAVARKRTRRS
ncbi:MAG: SDR family oxidoreductase [Myxococcota bacterium]|nr:SDR family oxidoreductase [Myxococcota bacterium]